MQELVLLTLGRPTAVIETSLQRFFNANCACCPRPHSFHSAFPCRAVEVVCREGPARVLELAQMGAEFTTNADGSLHLTRVGGCSGFAWTKQELRPVDQCVSGLASCMHTDDLRLLHAC